MPKKIKIVILPIASIIERDLELAQKQLHILTSDGYFWAGGAISQIHLSNRFRFENGI